MQQNPVLRTVRFIILSIGFVLFVLLAFHSASQASDPRFIKGKPYVFAATPAFGKVENISLNAVAANASTVSDTTQNSSQPSAKPGASRGSHKTTLVATGAAVVDQGQAKKADVHVNIHSKN